MPTLTTTAPGLIHCGWRRPGEPVQGMTMSASCSRSSKIETVGERDVKRNVCKQEREGESDDDV